MIVEMSSIRLDRECTVDRSNGTRKKIDLNRGVSTMRWKYSLLEKGGIKLNVRARQRIELQWFCIIIDYHD